ncbi:ferrochelatase, partial [Alphaproteobacteria bacterium]|nr:ferrochelatase [Alphaproteobacteria bacterium]
MIVLRFLIENVKKNFQNVTSMVKQNTHSRSVPQERLVSLLQHYQSGRYIEAEKLAISITQEFPQHPFGWKALGAVLGATGRKPEALDANQTAVTLSPQDAEAHNNLGNAYRELGRLDSVRQSVKKNGMPDDLVISFHGIPKSYFVAGDPYHCQCLKTARLLREELGWDKDHFHATFQSRFGSEPWLQPYTDKSVVALAENGSKHVAIMAPGFV